MSPAPGAMPARSATVIVRDDAVASSLELTLQACGAEVAVHHPSVYLTSLSLTETGILIVDLSLLPSDAVASIASLRHQGWRGLAILLSEDRAAAAPLVVDDCTVVLEKPFSGVDLVKIVMRSGEPDDAG